MSGIPLTGQQLMMGCANSTVFGLEIATFKLFTTDKHSRKGRVFPHAEIFLLLTWCLRVTPCDIQDPLMLLILRQGISRLFLPLLKPFFLGLGFSIIIGNCKLKGIFFSCCSMDLKIMARGNSKPFSLS